MESYLYWDDDPPEGADAIRTTSVTTSASNDLLGDAMLYYTRQMAETLDRQIVGNIYAEIATENTATITANVTFTNTLGDYYLSGQKSFTPEAEQRAQSLLKASFPALYQDYLDHECCWWPSKLYPITYRVRINRVEVYYDDQKIGYICVYADYAMPPADRMLQMLLHFQRSEKYVLKIGNWNGNFSAKADKTLSKMFRKTLSGKWRYRPWSRGQQEAWGNWFPATWNLYE